MRKLVPARSINRKINRSLRERCPVASGLVSQFKRALRRQNLGHFANLRLLDLALNEAESLAWNTAFPQLFFPALAEEKIGKAIAWENRQRALKASTAELCFAA